MFQESDLDKQRSHEQALVQKRYCIEKQGGVLQGEFRPFAKASKVI